MTDTTGGESPPGDDARAARRSALERRADRTASRLAAMRRRSDRLAWARIGLFCAAAGLALAAVLLDRPPFLAPATAAAALFVGAVVSHGRLEVSIARHETWELLLRQQLARADLDWARIPPEHAPARLGPHPFAHDLDLVGERSLHRLADTTVTSEASVRLRDWLIAVQPDADVAVERQAGVRELIPRHRFRLRLAAEARLASGAERWNAAALLDWLLAHDESRSLRPWLLPLSLLSALNIVLVLAAQAGAAPPAWRVTLPIYAMVYLTAMRGTAEAFAEALEIRDALDPMASVFSLLESYRYVGTPRLKELCSPFLDPDTRPSAEVRSVSRLLAAAGVRGNPFVWLLVNAAVPWDLYVAQRLHVVKASLADHAPLWLDAWYEVEALASLANLAYLDPDLTMPELVGTGEADEGVFVARSLGHPLLPHDGKVRNDFRFGHLGEIVVVTGSNMSGKSTFVKSVGLAAAMAFAGGPVDAASLTTVPFRLYASIRVTDSVTDGISYFYAEVKRLRGLLEALRDTDGDPLLFLIDEVFRGTNNRERLIGGRALIRAMAGERGVGLIATHDLELVALADEVRGVRNEHFRDDIRDGLMTFDYRLRQGPCPTTNALRIMAAEGLPTEVDSG